MKSPDCWAKKPSKQVGKIKSGEICCAPVNLLRQKKFLDTGHTWEYFMGISPHPDYFWLYPPPLLQLKAGLSGSATVVFVQASPRWPQTDLGRRTDWMGLTQQAAEGDRDVMLAFILSLFFSQSSHATNEFFLAGGSDSNENPSRRRRDQQYRQTDADTQTDRHRLKMLHKNLDLIFVLAHYDPYKLFWGTWCWLSRSSEC